MWTFQPTFFLIFILFLTTDSLANQDHESNLTFDTIFFTCLVLFELSERVRQNVSSFFLFLVEHEIDTLSLSVLFTYVLSTFIC